MLVLRQRQSRHSSTRTWNWPPAQAFAGALWRRHTLTTITPRSNSYRSSRWRTHFPRASHPFHYPISLKKQQRTAMARVTSAKNPCEATSTHLRHPINDTITFHVPAPKQRGWASGASRPQGRHVRCVVSWRSVLRPPQYGRRLCMARLGCHVGAGAAQWALAQERRLAHRGACTIVQVRCG